jgi:hypothetical protein
MEESTFLSCGKQYHFSFKHVYLIKIIYFINIVFQIIFSTLFRTDINFFFFLCELALLMFLKAFLSFVLGHS